MNTASPIPGRLPKVAADGLPPPAHSTATGISETPIVVMIVPITSGGKKRSRRLKAPLSSMVASPATITAP